MIGLTDISVYKGFSVLQKLWMHSFILKTYEMSSFAILPSTFFYPADKTCQLYLKTIMKWNFQLITYL